MRNLKKVLALVLVLALSLTMFAGAIETILPFNDVDQLTAEQLDALKLLYALGVIKGDGTSSNPNGTYTRAELAATLYRLYTGDSEEKYVSTYSSTSPYFADASGAWYTPYVNWAYLKGVIIGYGDGNFGPNDPVTGVQAATMLARLLGYEVVGENWAITASRIAIENGLDAGVESKDLFNENLTRGDMFVMVANTLNTCALGSKVTLAEEIFDLEIIEGAIMVGFQQLGGQPFTVFAFKDRIAGDVRYFISDLLSVEAVPDSAEELMIPKDDQVGEKFTLYVAKTKVVNGYKYLYAAYEEDRDNNPYYTVVTGTVDDGKLVMNTASAACLRNKLAALCYCYVDGVLVGRNADESFAAFAARYGVRNGAMYKLIDNDGDGLYEYIVIETLTWAKLTLTELIANVVSYDTVNNTWTLSDGKTYAAGQYWLVGANGAPTGIYDAFNDLYDLIGARNWTADTVQYKFYVCGPYIMKAEVCDETMFRGNYVLGLQVVDFTTYKGMQYVKFLTEDNTALFAFVSKINNVAAPYYYYENPHDFTAYTSWSEVLARKWEIRAVADWIDTRDVYENQLFYVNAYGNDTVELFTDAYVNTAKNNYLTDGAFSFDGAMLSLFGAISPVVIYGGDYIGAEFTGVTGADLFNQNNQYYYMVANADGKFYFDGTKYTQTVTADGPYVAIPAVFSSASFAGWQEAWNAGGVDPVAVMTKAPIQVPGETLSVSIAVKYATTQTQIFKAPVTREGKWYIQSYGTKELGAAEYDAVEIRFTRNGKTDAVYYDSTIGPNGAFRFVANGNIYDTGIVNDATLNASILAIIAAIDSDPNAPAIAYGQAQELNIDKGVIFVYGTAWNTMNRSWMAYKGDAAFARNSYGLGTYDDDAQVRSATGLMSTPYDQAFIVYSNGMPYAKAAKITAAGNDALPFDGTLGQTGEIFIYAANSVGMVNIYGRTIQLHTANGGVASLFVPYGIGDNFISGNLVDGDIIYVEKDAEGNVTNITKLCNILEFVYANTSYAAGSTPVKLTSNGYVSYDLPGYYGLTTTVALDLDHTYFAVVKGTSIADAVYTVVSCDGMVKALNADANLVCRMWTVGGNTFVLAASAALMAGLANNW